MPSMSTYGAAAAHVHAPSTYGPTASYYSYDASYNNHHHHAPSDDSFSDDGSVGPRDHIVPYTLPVKAALVPLTNVEIPSLDVSSAASTAPSTSPEDLSVEALSSAMAFMPLEDIEAARLAGGAFAAAADRVAPKPLGNDDVVFVRWEPSESEAVHHHHRGAPQAFPWRCLSCGYVTVGPRSCQSCRAPLATSACRVFLGQLRKDLTAELATAMVRSLCPDVTVLHMESHTNGAEGRGKGCAWAYVNSVEDAQQLVNLHKRVFVDLDAESGEGFWFVKDPALRPRLEAMAETLGAARGRPQWLPRQALVAELPSKSLISNVLNGR